MTDRHTASTKGRREVSGQKIHRYRAVKCVCCRGSATVMATGPSLWRPEIICFRCNVDACGTEYTPSIDGAIDDFLRSDGCKSRVDQSVLRYRGQR